MPDGEVDGRGPGAIQGDPESPVAEGLHAAAKPFEDGRARSPGKLPAGPREIAGDLVEHDSLEKEGDPIGFGFQHRWHASIGERSRLAVHRDPGDAVEVAGKHAPFGIGKGWELRLGFPVDSCDRLGLVRALTVEIPGQRLCVCRGLLESGYRMVFVTGHRQIGEEPFAEVHGLQAAATGFGEAGFADLVNIPGYELGEPFGTIEVTAAAVDHITERPGRVAFPFLEDRAVPFRVAVPTGANVGSLAVRFILTPLLGSPIDHKRGRRPVPGRQVVILDPDPGDASVRGCLDEGVHHQQVPRLAHRQPGHGGDFPVTRGRRQAVEQLLEKRDGGLVLALRLEVVEGAGAPDDAEAVGGADFAKHGMAREHVFGNIGAEDDEAAKPVAGLRNPEKGCGAGF